MSSTRKTPEHLKLAKNWRGVVGAAEAVGAALASEATEVAEAAVLVAVVAEAAAAEDVARLADTRRRRFSKDGWRQV
jgi:hypothetical protein